MLDTISDSRSARGQSTACGSGPCQPLRAVMSFLCEGKPRGRTGSDGGEAAGCPLGQDLLEPLQRLVVQVHVGNGRYRLVPHHACFSTQEQAFNRTRRAPQAVTRGAASKAAAANWSSFMVWCQGAFGPAKPREGRLVEEAVQRVTVSITLPMPRSSLYKPPCLP
jgi:hypothetical protein